MKTKEGGVMDIQKEREAFETWLFSTEKFKFRNKNFLFMLDEYGNYEDKPVLEHWETWQAAQAVPEGYVLVPREMHWQKADELACLEWGRHVGLFCSENRGMTATQVEEFRLRWCKNKAHKIMSEYKAVIEAQAQPL